LFADCKITKKSKTPEKKQSTQLIKKQPGQHPLTASLQMGDQQPSTAHHTEFSNFPFSRFFKPKNPYSDTKFPKNIFIPLIISKLKINNCQKVSKNKNLLCYLKNNIYL
jgi:hypothetical protein